MKVPHSFRALETHTSWRTLDLTAGQRKKIKRIEPDFLVTTPPYMTINAAPKYLTKAVEIENCHLFWIGIRLTKRSRFTVWGIKQVSQI